MKNSKGYFITKHDDFDEKVFVLTGPWIDKYASIIKSKKIKNIRLVLSMQDIPHFSVSYSCNPLNFPKKRFS